MARAEEVLELGRVSLLLASVHLQNRSALTGLAFSATQGVSLHDYSLLATFHHFARFILFFYSDSQSGPHYSLTSLLFRAFQPYSLLDIV